MRFFCFLFSVFLTAQAWADLKPTEMKSSLKVSSKIEGKDYLEKPVTLPPPSSNKAVLLPRPMPLLPVPQQASYLSPGILVEREGTWEGGDHLFNLPPICVCM